MNHPTHQLAILATLTTLLLGCEEVEPLTSSAAQETVITVSAALPHTLRVPAQDRAGLTVALPEVDRDWRPQQVLAPKALSAVIAGEVMASVSPYRDFERAVSDHYAVRTQPERGWMFLEAREATPPAFEDRTLDAEDRDALAMDSETLLRRIVSPSGAERFRQREILAQDEVTPGAEPAPARIVSLVGFYQRAISGIPVLGQGAMTNRFPDGTLKRMQVRWGARLSETHHLTTPWTPAEIGERFLAHLADQGVTQEDIDACEIALDYVLVPVRQEDGSDSLVLAVDGVLNPSSEHPDDGGGKLRGFLMPIVPGSPDLLELT